ncbi:MAG: peptidase M64 [Caldithrix sp.]|nr:peptidase M64 [Caldithrix sp.]
MMKRLFVFLILPLTLIAQKTVPFDQYFLDRTLRIDYYHIGDKINEWVTLDKLYKEGPWAGSTTNLIDTFNNGKYYIKIYDEQSEKLIYSRGFNSYFGEYQTTAAAKNGIKQTFHESALIPYPINSITFTLSARNQDNKLSRIFSTKIDPSDSTLITKHSRLSQVDTIRILHNRPAHNAVDLALLAEGYTSNEYDKSVADFKHFAKVLFKHKPFAGNRQKFNIYGVFYPSDESGCDEPTHDTYKNTALNTTFNSMGSPRYLLTEDNKALHDIGRHVPYDQLLIMVNQQRYGGGGIYNFYLTFTSNNEWRDYVFIHEFGHAFAGLADEYYSSSTAYDAFYSTQMEPVEPNITALLDPNVLKWRHLVNENTPIPTPWSKQLYDSLNNSYQKNRREYNNRIALMERQRAPQEEIDRLKKEAHKVNQRVQSRLDSIINNSTYSHDIGAFEGAGYVSEGLYRPMMDCIMFSKGRKPFCRVCEAAINDIIDFYTGQ